MSVGEITRAEIRSFADSIDDGHPLCHSVSAAREAGHPDLVAPPTFAIRPVLAAVERFVRGNDTGLDYNRIVHRGQRLEYFRPLHAGDVLTATARLLDVRVIRGNTVGRIAVELADSGGTAVCSALTTLVMAAGPAPAPVAAATDHSGALLGPVEVPLLSTGLRRYAQASGDFNPIHLDPAAAAAAGLPGVVAHGMLTAGLAMSRLTAFVPDPAAITWCEAVFTAPVVLGDYGELVVTGRAGRGGVDLGVTHLGHAVAQIRTALPADQLPIRNGSAS